MTHDWMAIGISLVSIAASTYNFALQRSMKLFREGKRDYIFRKDRPAR